MTQSINNPKVASILEAPFLSRCDSAASSAAGFAKLALQQALHAVFQLAFQPAFQPPLLSAVSQICSWLCASVRPAVSPPTHRFGRCSVQVVDLGLWILNSQSSQHRGGISSSSEVRGNSCRRADMIAVLAVFFLRRRRSADSVSNSDP